MLFYALAVAAAGSSFAIYGDCGSTGTRVYLIQEEPLEVEKIGKGVAVTSDPAAAAESFAGLVDRALAKVPEAANVSVHGLGTAGMRDLEAPAQAAIWAALESALRADPKRNAKLHHVRFRTISGNEEGYYGLVSANHLSQLAGTATAERPVGTLDLGGSSTQVAVPAKAEKAAPFLRSYPWGMEKARQRLAPPACFLSDSAEAPSEGGARGDAKACRAAIREGLVRQHAACEQAGEGPCLGEAIEWQGVPLLALSGLFYAADFADWVLRSVAGTKIEGFPAPRFADLEKAADVVCAQTEGALHAVTPPHAFTGAKKLPHRCFEINYQVELFKLYRVPDDGRITYVNDLNGQDVEWTLGAHLAGTNGSSGDEL